MLNKYPLLGSSADPTKISLSIKSIGAWVITGIVFFASTKSIAGIEGDLNTILTSVTDIVKGLFAIVSSSMTIFGLGRKIYYKLFKRE